jgi:hypothetical protein
MAMRSDFEAAGFQVEKTGRDPNHYTVHLAQPVTDALADRFNRVLGRTRP